MSKPERQHERRNFLSTAIKVAGAGALAAALPGDPYASARSGHLETLENSDSVEALMESQPLIFAGRTTPGATNWKPYPSGAGVFVEVETNLKIEKGTPLYIVSLGGRTNHWGTTGGNCVYPMGQSSLPDARGFAIYVNWEGNTGRDHPVLTPALVNSYGWHINWLAAIVYG